MPAGLFWTHVNVIYAGLILSLWQLGHVLLAGESMVPTGMVWGGLPARKHFCPVKYLGYTGST